MISLSIVLIVKVKQSKIDIKRSWQIIVQLNMAHLDTSIYTMTKDLFLEMCEMIKKNVPVCVKIRTGLANNTRDINVWCLKRDGAAPFHRFTQFNVKINLSVLPMRLLDSRYRVVHEGIGLF